MILGGPGTPPAVLKTGLVILTDAHRFPETSLPVLLLLNPSRLIVLGDPHLPCVGGGEAAGTRGCVTVTSRDLHGALSWGRQSATGLMAARYYTDTDLDKGSSPLPGHQAKCLYEVVSTLGPPRAPLGLMHRLAAAHKYSGSKSSPVPSYLPCLREQSSYHPRLASFMSRFFYQNLIRSETLSSGMRREADPHGIWWLHVTASSSTPSDGDALSGGGQEGDSEEAGVGEGNMVTSCLRVLQLKRFRKCSVIVVTRAISQVDCGYRLASSLPPATSSLHIDLRMNISLTSDA